MPNAIDTIGETAVRDIVKAMKAAIKTEAPGSVKKLVTQSVKGKGRAAVGTVKVKGIGRIVVAGQKQHVIEPVNGRALFWPGAAHPVMRVNHPLVPPNDFVSRGALAATPERNRILVAAAEAMGAAFAEALAD